MDRQQQKLAFGQALREIRRSLGLTQQDMAELLGVEQATFSNWERANVTLEPWQVFEIERALRIAPGSLSRLLGYLPLSDDESGPEINAEVLAKQVELRAAMNSLQQAIDHLGKVADDPIG